MRVKTVMGLSAVIYIFSASAVFAQAFGEYGRAVGSVPHGKKVTGPGPGGMPRGKSGGGSSVGGSVPEGRRLPSRLVVAASEAGLYPRQDPEAQKLEHLRQGEILTPMMQSAGGESWFMVKTEKGVVGWVRAAEVKEEQIKK